MPRFLLSCLFACALSLTAAPGKAATIIYSPPNQAQKTAFVRLDGFIAKGDAAEMENNLRDAQQSGKHLAVLLMSNGGDFDEAMAMGRVIRRYHADTYNQYCAAACVIAFLGGERRYHIATEATDAIVVSRPEYADTYAVTPSPDLKQKLDQLKAYTVEQTGSARFYQAMMAFPSLEPHTLTADEAEKWSIVTKVLREP